MSKSYLLLITTLVVVALAVGGFAYTRSLNSSQNFPSPQTPSSPSTSPSSSTTPGQQTPTPAPLQNQITLTVTSPKNGQQVSSPTVTVSGQTVPNADVAVNDQDIKADATGNFSTTITLNEGDNEILVTASNDAGNYSEWSGTVTYTPPGQ